MLARLILLSVLALAPASPYNQGNQLYARKDYAGAARAYRRALEAGPNADACYNLGNALFKSGHIGQAIVQYRRAFYLRPGDADIRANLVFARNYRADKVLTTPGPVAQALDDALHRLSRRQATVLAAAFFLLAALDLSLWLARRWKALVPGVIALGVLSLYCFVTQRVWTDEVNARPAVVIAPEANVLGGPDPEARQILLVHDGTEVRIRERRGDFLLVQLPGGSGGWLPVSAVERVYP